MTLDTKRWIVSGLSILFFSSLLLVAYQESKHKRIEKKQIALITKKNEGCVKCHKQDSPALVMEWEVSRHAKVGIGCIECHGAKKGELDAWNHEGAYVSALVTPKDCSVCHQKEYDEFSKSHHAKAGEILASLDNILAEKAAGLPHNKADAVNGCWQCHGSIIKFKKDKNGNILRTGSENKPIIDPDTWPNSGMGRLNPDGSKGSCHACHSRHAFQASLSRQPENCGKCHMGPDHPQLEIYNESKHGIAYYANKNRMALNNYESWVLGKDYSAAPTCASCHISSYMTPSGEFVGKTHDVGERISWTLRPVISSKLNMVIYEDGFKEDYPDSRELPLIGSKILTKEKIVNNDNLTTINVEREVSHIVTWEERRDKMKGACLNCHNNTYVDNFYKQFDDLVTLYNEKFAIPAKKIMDSLMEDGVLKENAPFEKEIQWVFWELWHHEGRRARHGASMMGPDYTHWHGMYEVAKHYYLKFLPLVIKTAKEHSRDIGEKYEKNIEKLLMNEEHLWIKGLSASEAEKLNTMYKERYDE